MAQTMEERFWKKVEKRPNGCWTWTASVAKNGYGKFSIGMKGIGAHRASWIIAHGSIPDAMMVCHNCPNGDNPACVNPAHLFLGSHAQNMADRNTKGRQARQSGSQNACARLSEGDVFAARSAFAAKTASIRTLARQYGVSRWAMQDAITGKNWKCVPMTQEEAD